MKSRVYLEIDLATIRSNFQSVQSAVAPLKVMAVLKADAYGLGAKRIATELIASGADTIGIAEPKELIKTGASLQILGAVLAEEIPEIVANNLVIPVTNIAMAKRVSQEALLQNKTVSCQFLIDTGMGRLGINHNFVAVIKECLALPNLKFTGLYSHFPVAYENREFSCQQIELFKQLVADLEKENITFPCYHIANSDGINNLPEAYQPPFTTVRCGINLYGVHEISGQISTVIKPAISLKSKLIEIRELESGSSIGYGQTYRLQKKTKIGTIPAGYADGVPLALSNHGFVIINNTLCPVVGRISMDYLTVSLENVESPAIGDSATLIGSSQDHQISVEDWARAAQTSPYQVICSFGSRVERVYI